MSSTPWTVVLPVKPTSVAKTRLVSSDSSLRQRLALAFATDTATAVTGCTDVAAVLVVTDDPDAASMARALGASVVADAPDAGLNAALRHGFEVVRASDGEAAVALLSADLPALRPTELAAALAACAAHDRSFVCDAVGIGTTLLAARAPHVLDPHFGPRSRAHHRHDGYVEVLDDATESGLASLRRDVDTWADMWDAQRLGVGAATAAVLAER